MKTGNLKPEVAAKLKNVEQGAATTVWVATSPQLQNIGGVYCENADIADLDAGNIRTQLRRPIVAAWCSALLRGCRQCKPVMDVKRRNDRHIIPGQLNRA